MSTPTVDADLARAVHRTGYVRRAFYFVVLSLALGGSASGAVEALGLPPVVAVVAVMALELGGVVVMNNADVRRRLGERATAARVLSAAIATGAVGFNWETHHQHLLGGFFAGMSALGYLTWWMHTENQRRDRLRARGDLPPTSPVYGAWQWLRHPWLTRRARSLAKQDTTLGLYGSLAAAAAQVRGERRQAAIAKVLHRKIRSAVDPDTADIATAVYDFDVIAGQLADDADYRGLTRLIAVDLEPARMLPTPQLEAPPAPEPAAVETFTPAPVITAAVESVVDDLDVPAGLFDEPDPNPWVYAEPVNEPLADVPPVSVEAAQEPAPRTRPRVRARTYLGHHGPLRKAPRRVRPAAGIWPMKALESQPTPVPVEVAPKRRMSPNDRTIRARLRDPNRVPRRPDGTVPIRSVKSTFGISQERAVKLLDELGLRRTSDHGQVSADDPVNGVEISA